MFDVILSKEEVDFLEILTNTFVKGLEKEDQKEKIFKFFKLKYKAIKYRELEGLGSVDTDRLSDVMTSKVIENIFDEYEAVKNNKVAE